MDAYFASVEQFDNPELRGKPVIICGRSKRSVVSTASYEARRYGVHSAMPYFKAKKLCPEGIFIRGRMNRYKEISDRIFSLLNDFSPVVEPVSIDEAYLDLNGCGKIIGPPETAALNIKKGIFETTGLSCSIGIAPLKFLSKIASDLNKPSGITMISREEMTDFIEKLDIKRVPGVGRASFKNLEMLSVKTLGDIKKIPETTLKKKFGKQGLRLRDFANGLDNARINPGLKRKSISIENTFPEDLSDITLIKKYLLIQSDEVARQLRQKKVKAKTISLKITFADFQQITRRVTLKNPTQSSRLIYKEAADLLEKEKVNKKLRLIGVGGSGLVSESQPSQGMLFERKEEGSENWEKAEKTIDQILEKFGKSSLTRAIMKKK